MSGETFQEQMARVRRKLREVDDTPPNHRPDLMPRTRAQRLAELEAIKAGHGLQPGQPIGSLFLTSMRRPADEPSLQPLPVWILEDERRVMARKRPAGARALSEDPYRGTDHAPPVDEPGF